MATIFNRSTNVFCAEALSDARTMLPEVRKPCRTLGRYFLKRGSPVGHSDDTS